MINTDLMHQVEHILTESFVNGRKDAFGVCITYLSLIEEGVMTIQDVSCILTALKNGIDYEY